MGAARARNQQPTGIERRGLHALSAELPSPSLAARMSCQVGSGRVVGKADRERGRSVRWLYFDFVVDRTLNPLFAAEVSFGCLNGNVAKEKLDLLQFASGRVTEPSASPAEVVGR